MAAGAGETTALGSQGGGRRARCRRDHAPCGGGGGGARRLPLPPRRGNPLASAAARARPLNTCQAGLAAAGRRRKKKRKKKRKERSPPSPPPPPRSPGWGPARCGRTAGPGAALSRGPWEPPGQGVRGSAGEGPWSRAGPGGGRPGRRGRSPGARTGPEIREGAPSAKGRLAPEQVRGVAGPHAGGTGNEGVLETLKFSVKPDLIGNSKIFLTFCGRHENVSPWCAIKMAGSVVLLPTGLSAITLPDAGCYTLSGGMEVEDLPKPEDPEHGCLMPSLAFSCTKDVLMLLVCKGENQMSK
ncbi:collagen alpha-1(I) chain-like [Harpia harpyja]|uniref:collagen alpha-1(I) chain-like n=1 Tax=Harpia harpyja TaxID=202280 RepID=UPI0022B0CDD8|nr:collagen alpha-1(I) chain-like [Harpia harpyja]